MIAERWVQVLWLWVVLVGGSEPNASAQTAAPAYVNGVSNANSPTQELEGLRPYVAEQQVSGVIRIFGNNYIPALMKAWEEGFRRKQPGIRFETDLPGSEAAMASLYGETADLAFIGREGYESETHAFEETFGYPPLGIEISSGSFATPHKTFALMVFVHKSNPLARLSLPELARLYGCLHTGDRSAITLWGQLGLKGEWEHRPIHLYGYTPTTGMARYFQRAVLNGSNRWADNLKEFDNGRQPNGDVINAGVFVLDALARDPNGIAYANFLYAGPGVKALALSKSESVHATYWEPTRPNAFRRVYPLTRFTTVFLNRRPGQPVDPKSHEFLRYILSRDGMNAILRDGSYLPLNAAQIQLELKKLE